MAEHEKKNFGLINDKGAEIGTYTGKTPRDAALKAANRNITEIVLREKGTKRLHYFKGKREQVKKPAGSPAWLPDMIWKANVKKIGVAALQFTELERNPKEMFKLPAKKAKA